MQFRISYIIYVYNAENTLERCIESLLYGEEKNIEIILGEDCSQDRSGMICRKFTEQFENIKCNYNDKYSGRAYTRNRALKSAKGKYIIFVESKDWACYEYGTLLCKAAEQKQKNLVVSAFRIMPGLFGYEKDCLLEEEESQCLESGDYFSLIRHGLLQMLWNKIFCMEVINTYNLQFDETSERYSEFHFVVDYIKAANCRKFTLLNRALYTCSANMETIFAGQKSIEKYTAESGEVQQLSDFLEEDSVKSKAECILKDSFSEKLRQRKIKFRFDREKKKKERQKTLNEKIIYQEKETLKDKDFTIISQNCIGGVFYHDMGIRFQSPTINLFFESADFLKFVSKIQDYINKQLVMCWGLDYPIGTLGDIKIHFMHYSTCREAADAWERRKARINYEKILVLATDRDGFSDIEFQKWQELPYKKLLFTVNQRYKDTPGVIYYAKYKKYKYIPDLIFAREFYKDGILVSTVNQI